MDRIRSILKHDMQFIWGMGSPTGAISGQVVYAIIIFLLCVQWRDNVLRR